MRANTFKTDFNLYTSIFSARKYNLGFFPCAIFFISDLSREYPDPVEELVHELQSLLLDLVAQSALALHRVRLLIGVPD